MRGRNEGSPEVANSYDHAFPEGKGVVTVKLEHAAGADFAILTVSDTGSGFAEQTGSKRHGVGLVRRMVHQVHGTADLHTSPGTMWTLRFPVIAAQQA
jgi:two-component sensor histidine kinase